MNIIVPLRPALGGIALAAFLALHGGAAIARDEEPQMSASPIPEATPVVALEMPPPSVAAPIAAGTCANDDFLAWRSVPAPLAREVTVCGTVMALPADATRGGPRGSFALDVDGTRLLPIIVDSGGAAFAPNPGDMVVVHGRYERAKSGADWIGRAQRVASPDWTQPGFATTVSDAAPK